MKYGAQLDESMVDCKGLSCLEHALISKDLQLLRALLSCLDQMTPAAQHCLEEQVQYMYSSANGVQMWLTMLAAKGLELVPHLKESVVELPSAAWPEVRDQHGNQQIVGLVWHLFVLHTAPKDLLQV
jgi:hypothetical protein